MAGGQSNAANAVSPAATVPRLVRLGGALKDAGGKPVTGAQDVTFSLYAIEAGGEPLWFETQTVEVDAQGRYSILLGAMHPDGLPMDLFTSGEARWLGVSVGRLPEQARILLVAVPYALKAADADTLGGKPATAYVATDQLKQQVESEVQAQVGESATTRTLIGTEPSPQAIAETSPATFTCATSGICVQASQSGAGGIALRAATGSATGIAGIFDNLGGGKIISGRTTGYAEKFSVAGNGNVVTSGSVNANAYAPTSGAAVFGAASAGTGATFGVRGQSASVSGVGVFGYATSPTGLTYGVLGSNLSASGTGLSGSASSVTGNTIGVRAVVQSPSGTAAIFDNLGGGKLISARTTGYAEKFSVAGNGNVTASGIFSGNGSGLTNVNAATLGGFLPAAFAPATGSGDYVAKAGDTMTGTLNLPANGLVAGTNQLVISGGNVGVGTATPAFKLDVGGRGSFVDGLATVNSAVIYATNNGSNVATPFPLSTDIAPAAMRGDATATNNNPSHGVVGTSTGTRGRGVTGIALSTTGFNRGVGGFTYSTNGVGVDGSALATTGFNVGVYGDTASPDGVAGIFSNYGGGQILSGDDGSTEVFAVMGNGDVNAAGTVTATSFVGDGSQLTNIPTTALAFSAATLGNNNFTGTQNITASTASPILGITQNGSGQAASVYAASGNGLRSDTDAADSVALWGETTGDDGEGVAGRATSATGYTIGVKGDAVSPDGTGVVGQALATSGTPRGVVGVSYSPDGIGVLGNLDATSGTGIGVMGSVNSVDATGGVFRNFADGKIFSAQTSGEEIFFINSDGFVGIIGTITTYNSGGETFSVDSSGNVIAAGMLTAASFVGAGSVLTGSTAGQILEVNQNGTGNAIYGATASTSLNSIGVMGQATGTSGETYGVRGVSQSTGGVGVRGDAQATSGFAIGVTGESASPDGRGVVGAVSATTGQNFGVEGHTISSSDNAAVVYGQASATSGVTNGVQGTTQSDTDYSSGVRGEATSTTAANFGVLGRSASTAGTGVRGEALSTTGSNVGVHGESNGDDGIGIRAFVAESTATAGVFDNKGGGKILSGQNNATEVFSVAGSGGITTAGDLTVNGTGTSAFAGNVTVAGDLTVSGTFANPSSRRWKSNIRTLENALDAVTKLRGVSYDLRATGKHHIGVIAEEVAAVVPEVVSFEANGQDARGVDYARLTALLIEAVKEQQAQIRDLKAELERLHAEVRSSKEIASR